MGVKPRNVCYFTYAVYVQVSGTTLSLEGKYVRRQFNRKCKAMRCKRKCVTSGIIVHEGRMFEKRSEIMYELSD